MKWDANDLLKTIATLGSGRAECHDSPLGAGEQFGRGRRRRIAGEQVGRGRTSWARATLADANRKQGEAIPTGEGEQFERGQLQYARAIQQAGANQAGEGDRARRVRQASTKSWARAIGRRRRRFTLLYGFLGRVGCNWRAGRIRPARTYDWATHEARGTWAGVTPPDPLVPSEGLLPPSLS